MWEPWIDGFTHAMRLRPDASDSLLDQADEETRTTMIFMLALQDINTCASKFTEKEIDQFDREAPDLIPNCVATILTQSRPELYGSEPAPHSEIPFKAGPRPGRNDPCSCGSGRKYKQCCGRN
ncbi:SEC-C metal-binding domain-containing protein [Roseivivax marinus]|uniref:SEC-C metal-binding domain-containing protein n=1 Tax=Roseivivax marinus TaxID=1379903 RepID=UPI0031400D06